MGIKVTNNAYGTLSASITSSATTIALATGQGARFPSLSAGDYFYGTLIDTSNNVEIVKVTARSSDTMTVVRAQDNTTARAYSTNDRFELRPTAALFDDLINGKLDKAGGTMTDDLIISGTNKRARVTDGTKFLTLGQWDGSNNRIESTGANSLIIQYGAGNTLALSHASVGDFLVGNSSGHVKLPFQPKWLYDGGTTLGSGWTTIKPSNPVISNAAYSTSTGLFTAPVSGTYYLGVWGLLYPADATDTFTASFLKNGATWGSNMGIQGGGNSTNHLNYAANTIMTLSQGDTCGFQLTSGGNGINAYSTQWSQYGFFLG